MSIFDVGKCSPQELGELKRHLDLVWSYFEQQSKALEHWATFAAKVDVPAENPWALVVLKAIEPGRVTWMMMQTGLTRRCEAHLWALSRKWPRKWTDYIILLLGSVKRLEAWPPPWPCWALQFGDRPVQVGDEAIQLDLQIAQAPDCRPYASIRWQPDRGSECMIIDADLPGVTAAEERQACEGLRLLKQLPPNRGGRPVGSGSFANAAEFAESVRVAIAAIRKSGQCPSQEQVAHYFNHHTSFPSTNSAGIRRWCRHYRLSWQDLVR